MGRRVLILEDRSEFAKGLARSVHDAGAAVEGPSGDLTEARAALRCGGFDSVVMRGELRVCSTAPVAATLRAKRIPIVFPLHPDLIGELSDPRTRVA